MAPRSRPRSRALRVTVSPEFEAELRASLEAADRGETMELTPEEAERFYETGELPERIERWAASSD